MPGTSIKDAIKKFEETLGTARQIYEEYPEKISDYDPLLLVEINKGCESTADCKKVRGLKNPKNPRADAGEVGDAPASRRERRAKAAINMWAPVPATAGYRAAHTSGFGILMSVTRALIHVGANKCPCGERKRESLLGPRRCLVRGPAPAHPAVRLDLFISRAIPIVSLTGYSHWDDPPDREDGQHAGDAEGMRTPVPGLECYRQGGGPRGHGEPPRAFPLPERCQGERSRPRRGGAPRRGPAPTARPLLAARPGLARPPRPAPPPHRSQRLDNLDMVPDLEELWVSYNQLSSLAGIEKLSKLRVLYASNNQLSKFDELERLKDCPLLRDVNIMNNPMFGDVDEADGRIEVLRRIPHISKLNGKPVEPEELEKAQE